MYSGKTFIAIRDEGILEIGMVFSFLAYENGYVYLWAHEEILGVNQFKFVMSVIEKNFKIV